MKRMHLALAAALVLGSSTVAVAQGGGAPPQGQQGRGGPNRMMEMYFKDITLTDAQKTKVDSIMGAYRTQMMAIPRGQDATDADRQKRMELQQQLFVQQMGVYAKSYLRDLRRDAVVETR